MAGKMIITELEGNAIIFAPDGSVRPAQLYAELKPEEVLVTENGSQALLKENGEREIRVSANSGFRFETPPDSINTVDGLRQSIEEGTTPPTMPTPLQGKTPPPPPSLSRVMWLFKRTAQSKPPPNFSKRLRKRRLTTQNR